MPNAQILVVEDEGIVAADIEERLRRLGYRIAGVVASGEEALRKVAGSMPDLVLMDVILQGPMDGVQAAEEIRRQHQVPVVFLTAHADQATLQRAKVTEPFGYILKPFEERELHTTVEIALYRYATESKLRRLEASLAAILGSMGDALVATDRWGLVTLVNPAATAITGWEPADALGKPLGEVLHLVRAQSHETAESPVSQIVLEERPLRGGDGLLLQARDGSERPVNYSAAPIRDADGRVTGVVWLFRREDGPETRSREHEHLRSELRTAENEIAALAGLLPVCSACGQYRDDPDYHHRVERHLAEHPRTQAHLGSCPRCLERTLVVGRPSSPLNE
jgi:PAS domain S-box-containing protein